MILPHLQRYLQDLVYQVISSTLEYIVSAHLPGRKYQLALGIFVSPSIHSTFICQLS